jgi:type I restriction enzyme R subunit
VSAIDTEKALLAPSASADRRLHPRALRPEDQARQHYSHGGKRLRGFNSLFATASIDAAKRYYNAFAVSSRTCRRRSG